MQRSLLEKKKGAFKQLLNHGDIQEIIDESKYNVSMMLLLFTDFQIAQGQWSKVQYLSQWQESKARS